MGAPRTIRASACSYECERAVEVEPCRESERSDPYERDRCSALVRTTRSRGVHNVGRRTRRGDIMKKQALSLEDVKRTDAALEVYVSALDEESLPPGRRGP